ncbi:MAG: polymer-forming cytoskeletal protein, partial [Enterococcus sp.]|nr:polymer-forming cytoskeletal protein [Enterococcus sp.]
MKKFELTTEFITNMFGTKLFRIKALVEFGNVKVGELGGYVEKEENVSQDGNAWVFDNAWVFGNAWVSGNA